MDSNSSVDFDRCPHCTETLEIASREQFLGHNVLDSFTFDADGTLLDAGWGSTTIDMGPSQTLDYRCASCGVALPESYQRELDRVLINHRAPQPPRFRFLFDAYLHIDAETKEEASQKSQIIESVVDAMAGCSLVITDAFGIEDIETGEEIRPVG